MMQMLQCGEASGDQIVGRRVAAIRNGNGVVVTIEAFPFRPPPTPPPSASPHRPRRSANPETRVRTGNLEVRHLPVTDLGGLGKIVQGQRPADPASLVVNDVDRCLRRLESGPLLAPRPMADQNGLAVCRPDGSCRGRCLDRDHQQQEASVMCCR
jgi:hypothetical protein